jgi:hypothetical protein
LRRGKSEQIEPVADLIRSLFESSPAVIQLPGAADVLRCLLVCSEAGSFELKARAFFALCEILPLADGAIAEMMVENRFVENAAELLNAGVEVASILAVLSHLLSLGEAADPVIFESMGACGVFEFCEGVLDSDDDEVVDLAVRLLAMVDQLRQGGVGI